ncbi:PPE domain-containing protein [Mycobacterium sp.]|uniref:PPE domain-containing protein n=1 Tax=Mycobacterium sp. TaxID=1785 RepID=UPI00257AF9FA|nr:PPE domain-containing protein [Mycobacterium sp.]
MAESLRADPAALRAAGSQAHAAGTGAPAGADHVQPCAPDVVSVGASTRFGVNLALARQYTSAATRMAQQFGVLLEAGAGAYDEQETASAATLGAGGLSGLGGGVSLPAAMQDEAALLGGGQPPPPAAAGEVPASPRDIARLIDSGRTGPGPQTWQTVADSLRGESERLERAAEQLATAIATAQQGWDSAAADAAVTQMRSLQTWFEGHAQYLSILSATASGHVEAFRTAAAEIPKLSAVTAAERELRAANDANTRSGGRLQPAVTRAQVRLSTLYSQSANGFKNYTFSAGVTSTSPPPAPPSWEPAQHADPVVHGPSDDLVTHKTDAAPTDAPQESVDAARGAGEDSLKPGASWPPSALDPDVDLSGSVDTAGTAPPLLPAMVGTALGGVGGALGGLSGLGSTPIQAMPSSMMSGLSGPSGGAPQQGGGGGPEQPAPQPAGGGHDAAPDSGGGEPGDTEPAGAQSSLSAPPVLASPAVEAAPMTAVPAANVPGASASNAGTPMGAMAPPMIGGAGRGGSGADNKQLYKDRELKVTVPPNSEPVKGRREARGTKDGAGK